jgi:hypothetical protein
MRITLRWKVLTFLESAIPLWAWTDEKNILFNVSPNTGLFRQFNIPVERSYVPQFLSPTVVYHQAIGKHLRTKYGIPGSRRFPYRLDLGDLGLVDLTIKVRLFHPNILSLTVRLSDVVASPNDWQADKLVTVQPLDQYKVVADIVRWTIGMALSLNHRVFRLDPSFTSHPALHLGDLCDPDEFSSQVETEAKQYVGILIRNRQWSTMADRVTTAVLEKNAEFNVKSSMEMTLVDKQGILFLSPNGQAQRGEYSKSFNRVCDLSEVARVYKLFLEKYLYIRATDEDFFDFVFAKIRSSIEEPRLNFTASVTNRHLWELWIKELALDANVRAVTANRAISDAVDAKRPYFDRLTYRWWTNPEFTYLLRDEIARGGDFDLAFLNGEESRRRVLEDFQEASRSLQANNFKAAIVMSGAIAEALLLAVLEDDPPEGVTIEQLRRESLSKYLAYASETGRITDSSVRSLLDNTLREWRNMIHPGKMIRSNMSVDQHRAEVALLCVRLLVKELRRTESV